MVLLRHDPHSLSPYLRTFPSSSYPCHKWLLRHVAFNVRPWHGSFQAVSLLGESFSSWVTDPPGNGNIQSVHFPTK